MPVAATNFEIMKRTAKCSTFCAMFPGQKKENCCRIISFFGVSLQYGDIISTNS